MTSTFDQLNLDPSLLKSLHQLGHIVPTPVQMKVIPRIQAGKDVIGTAQTGTGKTGAYLLPAMEKLIKHPRKGKSARILVLIPTRELALQVKDAASDYGRFLRLNVATILGGMPYKAQLRQFSKPVDIIVATPGRLIDHLEQKRLDLSEVEILILDEADRMLDMGFIDDVKHIASKLPKNRQTLLFTATLDNRIASLANTLLQNPERIEVLGNKITLENIEQRLHVVDDNAHKSRLLQHLLAEGSVSKAIIFSATKRGADDLAKVLRKNGHQVGALHGDMKQAQRNRAIAELRNGKIDFLVATDVAARGIDIQDISHVINYDLPKFAEDYVHRIGRTGRAGRAGVAISLVSSSEGHVLKRIERFTKQTFQHISIPGLEPKRGLQQQASSKSSRSGSGRTGSSRSGSGRSGTGKSSSRKSGFGRSESARSDSGRTHSKRITSERFDSGRPESGRSHSRKTSVDRFNSESFSTSRSHSKSSGSDRFSSERSYAEKPASGKFKSERSHSGKSDLSRSDSGRSESRRSSAKDSSSRREDSAPRRFESERSDSGRSESRRSSSRRSGSESSAPKRSGSDYSASRRSGSESSAPKRSGSEYSASRRSGSESSAPKRSGSEYSASRRSGLEGSAPKRSGSEYSASIRSGSERSASIRSGSLRSGSVRSDSAKFGASAPLSKRRFSKPEKSAASGAYFLSDTPVKKRRKKYDE